MIRITRIVVEEFRGIRKLDFCPDGKNFAIAGPNGTGKSGIVDAIEFGLTGTISRLSGKGQGGVSIKEHGPHVDVRNKPELAQVILEFEIPGLKKCASITRSVKSSSKPTITPSDADVLKVLGAVQRHPEFVLSRREIIKYVLAEPGERSKEVQALLQLDDIETVRQRLLKFVNLTKRDVARLEPQQQSAGQQLITALEIDSLTSAKLLEAANARRSLLGLPALSEIKPNTSLRDGLDTLGTVPGAGVPKVQAQGSLELTRSEIDSLETKEFCARIEEARGIITELEKDEKKLSELERVGMLETALEVFDGHECPVCKTEQTSEHFKEIVGQQLSELADIAKDRKTAEAMVNNVVGGLVATRDAIMALLAYAPKFPTPIDAIELTSIRDDLSDRILALQNFMPLSASINALSGFSDLIASARAGIAPFGSAISALPDPSGREAAREFLAVADERLRSYRASKVQLVAAQKAYDISKRVFDLYAETTTKALEDIFQTVEKDFRKYYRSLNSDDEGSFEAQLTPSIGKLGFEVDFYGRGFFPPGAYHSEGHQDAMGLCLYLALMKHLLGHGFSLAVLDDVLMSVDTGHRRAVCNLLKSEFPTTQFILTTHDGVWLRHMTTAHLVERGSALEFRKWDVDSGPAQWRAADTWSEIDDKIAAGDVKGGAALLRYHLEYLSAEICDLIGGQVQYRGDGRYDLGQLLPGAVSALSKLLKEGKKAANSWGDKTRVSELEKMSDSYGEIVAAALGDQWQINPMIHYNEWANLTKEDFKPVVEAFRKLEKEFMCTSDSCGEYLYLSYDGNKRDSLRCRCGAVNINLRCK